MKNKILALSVSLLALAACNKTPSQEAKATFIEMCKNDPRAKEQGFSCDCQGNILETVLKENEMVMLVDFLKAEKESRDKALELSRKQEFVPLFQKIAGLGFAIADKCGDPEKIKAQAEKNKAEAEKAAKAAGTAPNAETPAAPAQAQTPEPAKAPAKKAK